uniref:Uncharacterized protein AlNc14C53G4114 n=1 Tax=Albugo laibachii Nc14 TaxID=890382 RepID=F0WBS3_9STRA|nr:conserved hypothetical protein [Albugo laibachii Nc14]CCA20557.1 conserved hypothetical protein [Albugo laibachii Nc14]|eukprot:CCA20557.1 conserved hypothetical protein [Albugo laibachii Nc14]
MCLVTNENEEGESKARSKMNKKRFDRHRSRESDQEQSGSEQSELNQKMSAVQITSNARGKSTNGGFQRTRKEYLEDRVRSKYHEPSPVESDLSEPLTPVKYESDMQESEEDYYTYTHRFIGPNFDPSQGCARVLHGFRYLDLQRKPPRFDSDAAGPQLQRRHSSSTDSESGILTVPSFDSSSNTFQVTFTEKTIGFRTRIGISEDENLFAEVSGVDAAGPAQLAGINVGDILLSINDDLIEGDMEEEDVYELLLSASHPRTLVFRREVFWDEEPEIEATIPARTLSGAKKKASVPIFGKLSDAMVKGKARVGSALHRKRTVLHHNLMCGGCGVETIKGNLWTCSVCENTYLCEECYRSGMHGFEDSVEFEKLKYAVVVYKLRKKCKMFTLEFLDSLYEDICKERPEKMEYMGDWLADIIGGTSPSKIKVRGLETAAIHARARQRFVSLLMPLVSNRTDIEVNIEWIPDENTIETRREAPSGRRSYSAFEKVRIWISDKKLRTESPFAQ